LPAPRAAREVTIVANDIGPVGGMERVLAGLISGLRGLGYGVTVVARTCELPAGSGVRFHRVRGPARPALFAYPWFLVAGSLTLWRRRRGTVQATGAIVANQVDVIGVHFCHQATHLNPSRATWLFRLHSRLVEWMTRAGERWCFRRQSAAVFACVSDGVADEIRAFYPELAERVVTVHNGIDTEFFTPGRHGERSAERARRGIAGDRLVALFVGSEWEGKGLRQLIEALALARAWELLVAGRGDRPRYAELAQSLGVARAVHWAGVVADVRALYRCADAFVLPSSYETFSLVTFEAAACSLPILATPVSGVRELVSDGESGFLIDQDPKLIGARLRALGADAELRRRLGAAARESSLRFTAEQMVAEHHDLYRRIAGETAAR